MRTINRASDVLTLNHETKAMGIWGDLFSIVGIIGTVISVLGVFLCLLSEDKSDIYIGLSVLLSCLSVWAIGNGMLCLQSIADNARQTNYLLMYQCGLLRIKKPDEEDAE